jgi:hypothetical protein
MNQNNLDKNNTIIWLAGHSRGGAVSGILAAYLIKEGYKVYSYNFATPNQVQDRVLTMGSGYKNPSTYQGIYNIVNSDDLVPQLPLTSWGFTKYGYTRSAMSLNPSNEDKWSNRNIKSIDDNASKYKTSIFYLNKTIEAFEKISSTRNGCYQYEKINNKKISFNDNDDLFALYNAYPEWAALIDEFNSYTEAENTDYIYMKPVLFMQILAGVASADANFKKVDFFIDGLPLFGGYFPAFYDSPAFNMALFSLNSGYMKPHYVDAYIILCEKR